jgi:AcrR family transcriptional regulator
MTDDHPPLPPGLALLWGRREQPRRGPRAELSVDAIVAAAIRLADSDGLDAVSMARVAKEVGFTTMSLYRHVGSKDELLQLMWNASAQGADSLVLTGDGWRDRLTTWALVQRELIDRHSWITQMPMAVPPLAPNSLTFVEKGLQSLDGSGLDDETGLRVLGLISSYTLSEARMAHDARRAAAGRETGQRRWSFEGLLRELVDPDGYPRLHRIAWATAETEAEAARSGQDGDAEADQLTEFRFGLDRILDGVQALVERAPDGDPDGQSGM